MEVMKLKDALKNNILLFDGAMGTELNKYGLLTGESPEIFNITHPEIIREIHKKYIDAGCDIVTANTFGANEYKLSGSNVEDVVLAAVKNAREAGAKYVALDVGPIGELLAPMGTLSFERAYEIFKRQILAGISAGVDLILIETISDLYEAKAAILAAKENCNLPVICTMTFEQGGRTFLGTDAITAAITLSSLGVDAAGVNCSLGPKELLPVVKIFTEYADCPIIVQPNAGLPRIEGDTAIYDITPSEFVKPIMEMADMGVTIFGGCCGTDPEFIREIRKNIVNRNPVKRNIKAVTAAASGRQTVILDNRTTVIGERINPTGKKKLKEALREQRIDYIIGEALDQTQAGADILDINVGLPEIDETKTIQRVIKEVQAVTSLPLQIDSSDAKAIEAGARIYNGRPIINSVNGKSEVMDLIFPIAKKYGALVVGLTLDENGIPNTAEGRFEIAERIIKRAAEYGIKKEDILIDCLVLTASAQQKEVMETLKAIKLVKSKLGVKTILGVSNVSFGLPNRTLINSTFLAAALGAGLDAPIINPLSAEIMAVIDTFKLLNNEDVDGVNFIKKHSESEVKPSYSSTQIGLFEAIVQGRREEAAIKTKELLKEKSPLQIINEYFIPALNYVGDNFEKNIIFLPQLIQSAEAVKSSFEVLNEKVTLNDNKGDKTQKILLATVKGDIHDIGKNIVKMLLQSYNYDVIDMGRDVDPALIVERVKSDNIQLVGLSALMTTTVKSMKTTIEALKNAGLSCKTVVGGAVLTEEYAKMVGADFYAKDAMETVRIANSFFNRK